MRKDLNKLLCERERAGHDKTFRRYRRMKKHRVRSEEGDDQPDFEGIKKRYGNNGKEFNENLNPLKGQIRKFVGKPWDKFYSELCKVFDKRSVINQHILSHLDDFVARNVYVGEDGVLRERGRYTGSDVLLSDSYRKWFVDPRDGILKANRAALTYRQAQKVRAKREQEKKDAEYRDLKDGRALAKIDDIWFVFTVKSIPEGTWVYEKPGNKELFRDPWSTKYKTWEQLSDLDKKRHGYKHYVGARVFDELTQRTLLFEPFAFSPKVYHSNKRTASHKLLKKAGIIG